MRTTIQRIALSGLAVTWGWLGFVAGIHAQSVPSTEGPGVLTRPTISSSATGPAPTGRPDDEKALRSIAQAYVHAYDAGDAHTLASLFTDDAEMIDENGERLRGPATIESVFATMFKDRPGATFTVFPASLRFISPDVAQEEGRNLVKLKGDEGSSTRHYTLTFVKQGNRWRYSRVREELETGISHHQRLEELAWLVGEWTDESPDSLVHTTCRWTEDGNFLLRDFTVRVQGKSVMTVSERIGWDPSKRQIVSWVFDSEGGHGTGAWSRDANAWVIKSCGVLPDGRSATATHVLTRVSPQSARWASIERTVGDRVVHDRAEYLMVRQPPKPQAH